MYPEAQIQVSYDKSNVGDMLDMQHGLYCRMHFSGLEMGFATGYSRCCNPSLLRIKVRSLHMLLPGPEAMFLANDAKALCFSKAVMRHGPICIYR